MKQWISFLIMACITASAAQAATTETPVKKPVKKTTVHKVVRHPAEVKPEPLVDEDDKTFEAGAAAVTELNCELGSKLTLYRNSDDDMHMGLRWKQRVHQMTRVSTTTGANRFENVRYGLVWIGIPAKGMLLDSKHGQQLANECKDTEQMMASTVVPAEPTKTADVPPPIKAHRADRKPKS